MGFAAPAELALTASDVERDADLVADGEILDILSDRSDGSCGLVPEDVTHRNGRPVSLPGMPVATADATGVCVDDDSVGVGGDGVDVTNVKRFVIRF
jgi:hypothetical protein